MKSIFYPIILSGVLFWNTIDAQVRKDSIFWENGDVTFLSDLNNVWIILKKGSDLKNVRIREINKEKGILTYEKEKCLHDVNTGNIKHIQPGKYALSYMHFYADNTPYIKKVFVQMDALTAYSDFKSVKVNKQIQEEKKEINQEPEDNGNYTTIAGSVYPTTNTSVICDTIIEVNGIVTYAKVLEINSRVIRYKKIKNPYGPVYVKSSKDAQITKYDNCYTINYSENK